MDVEGVEGFEEVEEGGGDHVAEGRGDEDIRRGTSHEGFWGLGSRSDVALVRVGKDVPTSHGSLSAAASGPRFRVVARGFGVRLHDNECQEAPFEYLGRPSRSATVLRPRPDRALGGVRTARCAMSSAATLSAAVPLLDG